jgi:hypothetical protein
MDGKTTYKEKTKDISPSPPSSGPTVRDNRRDCCATTSIRDLGFTDIQTCVRTFELYIHIYQFFAVEQSAFEAQAKLEETRPIVSIVGTSITSIGQCREA